MRKNQKCCEAPIYCNAELELNQRVRILRCEAYQLNHLQEEIGVTGAENSNRASR